MPVGDLRWWLQEVEQRNELRTVLGAHWRGEIGAASELNLRSPAPLALLFDEIIDYPPGYRVLTGTNASSSRLGITLRLGADLSMAELTRILPQRLARWRQDASQFPIEWVDDGPVLEVVERGSGVDLMRFPAPLWHLGDGGRYLGTSCLVITRDPASGWINGASYRMQVHGPRELGLYILTGKHGRMHLESYFARGEPCPVVVSFGHDPLLAVLGGIEIPHGVSELEYAGAVAGEQLRVLPGEVTGLPIPAHSELAVEGWVQPGDVQAEGPFGEFHGYYSGTSVPQPVLRVERVLHRRDPILLGAPPGRPPHDYSFWVSVLRSALVWEALETAGVPCVKGVWQHEVGGSRMLLVVSIQQRYAGHARQAALVAAGCRAGAQLGRYVIVVDDDVDPSDLTAVMWAVATRSDPARDIDIVRQAWGSLVDPQFVSYQGADPVAAPFNSRALIDACIPYDRIRDFPRPVTTEATLLDAVRAKWPWIGRSRAPKHPDTLPQQPHSSHPQASLPNQRAEAKDARDQVR